MERKADLPPTTEVGVASRLSSSPPPDFLRHVQAAFKRHKPLNMLPSNVSRARRVLVPQSESMKNVAAIPSAKGNNGGNKGFEKFRSDKGNVEQEGIEQRKTAADSDATPPPSDDSSSSSITPPSVTGTVNSTHNENLALGLQKDESKAHGGLPNTCVDKGLDSKGDSGFQLDSADGLKRVQSSHVGIEKSACLEAPSQRADVRISDDSRINHLSSHLSSIAVTEGDCNLSDRAERAEPLALNKQGRKQRDVEQVEITGMSMRSTAAHMSAKTSNQVHEQHSLAFLGKDMVHPVAQSSAAGSSCITTTSAHSMSAHMLTSTTYSPLSNQDGCSRMDVDPLEFNLNPQPLIQGSSVQPSGPSFQSLNPESVRQPAVSIQVSMSAPEASLGILDDNLSKGQSSLVREGNVFVDDVPDLPKAVCFDEKSSKGKGLSSGASDIQSQAPQIKCPSSRVNLESSQSSKMVKAISGRGTSSGARKKNYDPDVFFKVNGTLYQRLGKIGSGGSSEVFKVISSDCTIYALKKIKLKGRDYSTAYGFCQEIEYLKRLKGKKNIIQLIDYEVTDKSLLAEVMNGSMNIKDSRIKDDGYIYMVLEYGEIDLAHMLSQKWKEMDSSCSEIDENWLRFFWQQILQAVNTIHEERIVHSDLKPANFLLVKGSLKLIDFGIAKAIMSDTTNIQRDAQVGTLNYMSPEAFMWNEHDANGNTIKCGRPSDIWSLGCILYQMVYGRTPFAEYKTFWAKFKVITDRNHVITYDPVSNSLLVDLMKKCLAWERTERWRIPQLLQHPFLVPPIPSQLPTSNDEHCRLLMQITKAYGHNSEVSRLCFQLQQLISNAAPTESSV